MKYVYLDFPNGERWRVPAKLIAEKRARYYAEKDHPNDVEAQKEAKRIEVDHALNDRLELFDWLRNNMSWEDVEAHATRVEGPQDVDKSDFYNTADLEVIDVDPNDDPDSGERMPNGVYLIADTPRTATPLAVEDGSGDRALLREALAEHNVEAFGASTDYPEVRGYVTDRIAAAEEDGGAPVADVIEATAEEFTLGTAIDVLRDLHRTGEVYAPTKTTLRRTDQTES